MGGHHGQEATHEWRRIKTLEVLRVALAEFEMGGFP
jgi:hypothetical protein